MVSADQVARLAVVEPINIWCFERPTLTMAAARSALVSEIRDDPASFGF